jgi:zeaxanthin glucosyltransferase
VFDLFHKIVFFGLDKNSLLHAVAKSSGLRGKYINHKRVFHPGIKNIPELVLCAREFDFPRKMRDRRYFVGPMVELDRRDVLYDRKYLDIMLEKDIETSLGNTDKRPLIYCSLGTLNAGWQRHAEKFFRTLIEAFSTQKQYQVVISIGTDIKPEIFDPLPDNINLFQLVPQLDILRRASLMITHGGINSINECVFLNIPMIVYPLNKDIDQRGNAARIEYHGMGLRGNIRDETSAGILEKINAVMTDPSYKKNVARMKEIYRSYDGAHMAADIIRSYLLEDRVHAAAS